MTETTTTEFIVPEELAPYYREPSPDDVVATVNVKRGDDYASALDRARQSALGWAQYHRAQAVKSQAEDEKRAATLCQVCGLGYASPRMPVHLDGGPAHLTARPGPLPRYITAHFGCARDLETAAAVRRLASRKRQVEALLSAIEEGS